MVTSQIRNGHDMRGKSGAVALAGRWTVYLILAPVAALAAVVWIAAPRSEFGKFACMVVSVAAFLAVVIAFDLPLPH